MVYEYNIFRNHQTFSASAFSASLSSSTAFLSLSRFSSSTSFSASFLSFSRFSSSPPPYPSPVAGIEVFGVCVCLYAKFVRFSEWYLQRLQTQIPLGVLARRFQRGPEKTSFKDEIKRFPGPCFEHFFSKTYIFKTQVCKFID